MKTTRVRQHKRRTRSGTTEVVKHTRVGVQRDNRSIIIKQALQKAFPGHIFQIRIEKYAGGESINIKTNYLLPHLPHTDAVWRVEARANPSSADYDEYNKYRKRIETNNKREEEIRSVASKLPGKEFFEDIDYDEFSGEVLQGANRYFFVGPLSR